jgi:hypothetical protein
VSWMRLRLKPVRSNCRESRGSNTREQTLTIGRRRSNDDARRSTKCLDHEYELESKRPAVNQTFRGIFTGSQFNGTFTGRCGQILVTEDEGWAHESDRAKRVG